MNPGMTMKNPRPDRLDVERFLKSIREKKQVVSFAASATIFAQGDRARA